jgi:16S rRNA (cytosine1402-N4)-methyltransferase
MSYTKHKSVLFEESLDAILGNGSEGNFADLTFGGGGHTTALAKRVTSGHVFAFDQDPEAFENGIKRIEEEGLKDKITLIKSNFANFSKIVPEGIDFQGVLMDLGVSSHHFDKAERGFSFRFEADLDMRMAVDDPSVATAADIINTYSAEELTSIFQRYGEEKFSKRIADKIVELREVSRLNTTKEIEDIAFHCYPKKMRFTGRSPATKVFQALRIEVNKELEVLEMALEQVCERLAIGGRLAIITFHSLEDRIVKNKFKDLENRSDILFQVQTKKPIIPSAQEILENSRSRSAKLRIIERTKVKRNKNKYAHLT